MSDGVFDTTVVAFANKDIALRKAGNSFDRRLRVVEAAAERRMRIRYNARLLGEYADHIRQRRNDVIELFFAVLDSAWTIRVRTNRLSRQNYDLARQNRWPGHDQHLLAAAIGGDRPRLFVTEQRLANCAAAINRIFGVRVVHV